MENRADVVISFQCSPRVLIPTQLKYRVSFFEMYVFPRAGKPTMTTIVGALLSFGPKPVKESSIQTRCKHNSFVFDSTIEIKSRFETGYESLG